MRKLKRENPDSDTIYEEDCKSARQSVNDAKNVPEKENSNNEVKHNVQTAFLLFVAGFLPAVGYKKY